MSAFSIRGRGRQLSLASFTSSVISNRTNDSRPTQDEVKKLESQEISNDKESNNENNQPSVSVASKESLSINAHRNEIIDKINEKCVFSIGGRGRQLSLASFTSSVNSNRTNNSRPTQDQAKKPESQETSNDKKSNNENNQPSVANKESLSIYAYRDEIIDKINENCVTIISAPTGSGKTTQVPQFILEDAAQRGSKCNILVAQPRKIAAITIAKRVSQELNCQLGEIVGYQVGLSKKANISEDDKTQLLFCTTGVILQKLILEKSMARFSHIILDEVHESDIDMDLLMTIVRELLLHNSMDTKVILMSATFQVQKFARYFTIKWDDQNEALPGIFKLEMKRKFQIENLFLESLTSFSINYSSPGISPEIYNLAKDIIISRLKNSQKSILVFLPGIYEIETLYSTLKTVTNLSELCLICVLHSSLSTADQRIAFMPADKPKVVLSTNLAESSVTITNPEVDCVIDFGLTKYLSGSTSSIASLKLDWASQSSMQQRAGRTGRTCNGIVYRLVHSRHYKSCPEFAVPEMTRCPLETVILRVKMLDVETPASLLSKTMHPPDMKAIVNATMILKELGGLQTVSPDNGFTANDGKLTYVGRIMATLPVDARITKFIILGYMYSVLEEAIIIGAGLSIKGIFRNNFVQNLESYRRKLIWADGSGSDLIAMLNAYKLWKFMKEQGRFRTWKDEVKWCDEHNLERKSLLEMLQLVEEITSRLSELQMRELKGEMSTKWEEKKKPLVLKICIAGAFLSNCFICGQPSEDLEKDIYKQVSGKSTNNIVYFRGMDRKHIGEVYQEQIKRKLVELRVADNIDDMNLTFDKGSTKVYVQFTDSNAMIDTEENSNVYLAERYFSGSSAVPEKIMPEVYRAEKLRQMEHRFRVDVMATEESQEYAKKYDIDTENMGGFGRKKNVMKYPELCVLPTPSIQKLKGVVTHIDHCNKFYFQPFSEGHAEIMNQIILKLIDNVFLEFQSVEQLFKSQQVVVSHENEWKRAKVINTFKQTQTATCFTFDYGDTIEVPLKNIFKVTESHKECFEYSERCFEASLAEISPSILTCPRGKWTRTAIEKFRSLVCDRECTIDIYSCVEEIVSVKLWCDGKCVNDVLLDYGYAQKSEENFLRKHDHEMRRIVQSSEFRFVSAADEFQGRINTMNIPYIPEPPINKCRDKVYLKGPISPIHSNVINSIYLNNPTSSINIESSSVNSIYLQSDLGCLNGRLVVAAAINRSTHGLTLHETTLMPDLPGLPVILAMIFAPNMIYKRNSDRTRYDYVQFGLGADPETHESYFPEHDCILPVNFVLDEEDATLANGLRINMSYLSMTELTEEISSLDDQTKFDLLTETKEKLWKILSKHRPLLPLRSALNHSGDWLTENQKDAVVWETIFNTGYPLLRFPPLYKLSSAKKAKLLKEIEKLEDISRIDVSGDYDTKSRRIYICPICEREYNDTSSLKIHFMSEMHINGRKMLQPDESSHEDLH